MTVYDAHIHYGDPELMEIIAANSPLREKFPCYRTFQHWNMVDYPALFARNDIKKAVIIPFVFAEHDKTHESLRVINFAKRTPGLFPYALLDEDNTEFVTKHKDIVVGVKEHIVLHESELTPQKKKIFAQVKEYGMTLLLHSWAAKRIEYVQAIQDNFPGMKIQIAHLGRDGTGEPKFIYHILESLAHFDSVFFDTSTVRSREVLEKAVDIVGSDRILYGSDFPFFMDKDGEEDIIKEQINHVLETNLSSDVKEKIMYKNFDNYYERG